MKQVLDTFGRWGFFALYAILLIAAAFWIRVKIDAFFSPDEESESLSKYHGLEELSLADLVRVRDTLAMWCEINDAFRRKSGGHDYAKAYKELDSTGHWFYSVKGNFRLRLHECLYSSEKILRKKIEKVIDAIPGFRDSEEFKTIIERFPTYKHLQ